MPIKKTIVHLFTGFLGTGKTTLIHHLMSQKPENEAWVLLVNEFGEIGIDGAVLSENGIPVREIAGGCLCCVAGVQTSEAVAMLLRDYAPDRLLIEASGLAHAATVTDELKQMPYREQLQIGTVFTVVDPRQFVDDRYFSLPLYRDQVAAADVLVAGKMDLCDEITVNTFRQRAQILFPPKNQIIETTNSQINIEALSLPLVKKSRYHLKRLPENTLGLQSQGFSFEASTQFNAEQLTQFFNDLPMMCEGLVRAKGVFHIEDVWVWINWTPDQWGLSEVAWRRDNRFEMIAKKFDADAVETILNNCIQVA